MLPEPANNCFVLYERFSPATGVVILPIGDIRLEQFLKIPMERIRSSLFTHLLQQFAQTFQSLAVELNLDA